MRVSGSYSRGGHPAPPPPYLFFISSNDLRNARSAPDCRPRPRNELGPGSAILRLKAGSSKELERGIAGAAAQVWDSATSVEGRSD